MLSDGLVLLLVMLLLMPDAVECVCPFCFGGVPSCSYASNQKCPADATIAENIALVAAVSSATAIAGGKFFKMPGVLAQRYLRMFTSTSLAALLRLCLVPQVNCWHRLRAVGHDHCPRGHAGHPQRPDHRG